MKCNLRVLATAILVALVACVGVAQEDNNPESLFKKMEDRLVSAKTLQIRDSVEEIQHVSDKPDLKREAEIQMWVDGERVRIQMEEAHTQGKAVAKGKRETLSDGQEMRFLWNEAPGFIEEPWLVQKTPTDWRVSVLRGLAQYECEAGFFFCHPIGKAEKSVRTESFPAPSNLKLAGKEKLGGVEAYRIDLSGSKREGNETVEYSGIVWISVGTGVPLKREKRYAWKTPPHGPREFTITESFKPLELDKPIDPKVFEIPK